MNLNLEIKDKTSDIINKKKISIYESDINDSSIKMITSEKILSLFNVDEINIDFKVLSLGRFSPVSKNDIIKVNNNSYIISAFKNGDAILKLKVNDEVKCVDIGNINNFFNLPQLVNLGLGGIVQEVVPVYNIYDKNGIIINDDSPPFKEGTYDILILGLLYKLK